MINLSIHQKKIPADVKMARVVPLHQQGSKTEVGNYRPVSVLGVVSKILEQVVCNQPEGYLESNHLLDDYQLGFCSSFSTDTCLIHLTEFIRKQMSSGFYTGMALLDLQKAFDTLDYEILLMKFQSIGLNASSVQGFGSYLSGRRWLM